MPRPDYRIEWCKQTIPWQGQDAFRLPRRSLLWPAPLQGLVASSGVSSLECCLNSPGKAATVAQGPLGNAELTASLARLPSTYCLPVKRLTGPQDLPSWSLQQGVLLRPKRGTCVGPVQEAKRL